MALKTALFDLDGTVLDSLPLIINTYRKVFTDLDIPWGDGEVVQWIGRPIIDIAKFYAGEERWEDFVGLYQSIYADDHDRHTRIFPGAVETLEGLKQRNIKLGIVTSKRRPATMRSLDFLNLGDLFGVVVTASDVDKHKPNPEPVLKALEVLNTNPGDAVFVGDSPYDIISGRKAGVCTVGVTWGMANREELKSYNPDHLLDDWTKLQEFLNYK